MTKKCIICGKEFIPKRSDQVTCAEPPCRREYKRQYQKRYGKKWRDNAENKEYKAMKMREYRQQEKDRELIALRGDPERNADSYAKRQMQKTLAMVGKVEV